MQRIVNHTSGLRSELILLVSAGWRLDKPKGRDVVVHGGNGAGIHSCLFELFSVSCFHRVPGFDYHKHRARPIMAARASTVNGTKAVLKKEGTDPGERHPCHILHSHKR
jgi:hypothetical protein